MILFKTMEKTVCEINLKTIKTGYFFILNLISAQNLF